MRSILVWLLLFGLGLAFYPAFGQPDSQISTPQKIWIFFDDKDDAALQKNLVNGDAFGIKPQALVRRAKLNKYSLIDWYDLPLDPHYLVELKQLGIQPLLHSRWLNAVSACLNFQQTELVAKLPFVRKMIPTNRFVRKAPEIKAPPVFPFLKRPVYSLDYGQSFTQNYLIAVPEVHELGINGYNVNILMLDTGFNYQIHNAFSHLQVLAEFDFVHSDSITHNEAEDPQAQHNHGTQTLGTIGGFQQGQLIGPAFQANYLLAKTESVGQETVIEEDCWVAGLEWGERNGADIASSSLGYSDWYTYQSFDGNTAITTRAADIAVSKGMVVINSMGNNGNYPGSIVAPADGDSVIAVGAVTPAGDRASFSSIGPTWDQRIKPDVMAPGSFVHTVSPNSSGSFTEASGTSFSCPLVAGVAALLLSAHPELTPMQVRDALRLTADRASNPDNEYGWGLVNALDAVLYHGMVFSNVPTIEHPKPDFKLIKIKVRSKYGTPPASVYVHFRLWDDAFDSVQMLPTGQKHEYAVRFEINQYGEQVKFYFSAEDSADNYRQHPFNAPNVLFTTDGELRFNPTLPGAFKLYQNFPNPFHRSTTIQYSVPQESQIKIQILNDRDQRVRELVNEVKTPGHYYTRWYGRDQQEKLVPSGLYQIQLQAENYVETRVLEFINHNLLHQNHPNPFNQSTVIPFTVARGGAVTLKIYNIRGQFITSLLNDEYYQTGNYKIWWDGIDASQRLVPSGIYFCVLSIEDFKNIKKMTLVR